MGLSVLFNCESSSVVGIKNLYVITKDWNGKPIQFPLDRTYVSGTDDIVPVYVGYEGGFNPEDAFEYYEINPKYAVFDDEMIESRQGILYNKTLEFRFPNVNDEENNAVLNTFFDNSGMFALSQIVVLYIDSNNQQWISGYDLPFQLKEFDLQTDSVNGDNSYYFKYVQSSYMPKKNFKLIYGKL